MFLTANEMAVSGGTARCLRGIRPLDCLGWPLFFATVRRLHALPALRSWNRRNLIDPCVAREKRLPSVQYNLAVFVSVGTGC